MRSLRQIAVVSSLAVSSSALAQDAVEWRVADGGNGHWYQLRTHPDGIGWENAQDIAEADGAHLTTISSANENAFVFGIANQESAFGGSPVVGPWIGGRRVADGGWEWVTGEPWSYVNWYPPNPDGPGFWMEDRICLTAFGGRWNDFNASGSQPGLQSRAFVIEYSADCNSDGIVDYGQIRAGELVDANANHIPDCCETASTCPNSLSAREWPLAIGGNGHWYQLRIDPLQPFSEFNARCMDIGGHMATITTSSEHAFLIALMNEQSWFGRIGWPAIGLSRATASSPWIWVTGELANYLPWAAGEPNDAGRFAQIWGNGQSPNLTWSANGNTFVSAAIIEWSADCNSDGIVDYGQIRAGELVDANANHIPDCCESQQGCNPCPADVDGSGSVNGVDLAAILNTWGTSGGKYPGADVNRDGVVNAADLTEVLNGWGACP